MTTFKLIFEFLFGGFVVYKSVSSDLQNVGKFVNGVIKDCKQCAVIVAFSIRLLLGIIGGNLLVDPIIPGIATTINIYEPTPDNIPSGLEHLRVTIYPLKLDGNIDTTKVQHIPFPINKEITTTMVLDFFERSVKIILYDETSPDRPLSIKLVSLSPYVRVGLWDENVHF